MMTTIYSTPSDYNDYLIKNNIDVDIHEYVDIVGLMLDSNYNKDFARYIYEKEREPIGSYCIPTHDIVKFDITDPYDDIRCPLRMDDHFMDIDFHENKEYRLNHSRMIYMMNIYL